MSVMSIAVVMVQEYVDKQFDQHLVGRLSATPLPAQTKTLEFKCWRSDSYCKQALCRAVEYIWQLNLLMGDGRPSLDGGNVIHRPQWR